MSPTAPSTWSTFTSVIPIVLLPSARLPTFPSSRDNSLTFVTSDLFSSSAGGHGGSSSIGIEGCAAGSWLERAVSSISSSGLTLGLAAAGNLDGIIVDEDLTGGVGGGVGGADDFKISWASKRQVLTLQGTSYTNHGHRYAG